MRMGGGGLDFLTLTLNPCVDRTLWVEEFGEKIDETDEQSGGKGINIARVLTALGAETVAIAPIGGKTGARFAELARSEGVNLETIGIKAETRAITTTARRRDAMQQVARGVPPAMTDAECAVLYDATLRRMSNARCLVIGGSACSQNAARLVPELIEEARKRNVRTFLDSNGAALRLGAQAPPDVIKPNQKELSELVGREIEPGGEEMAAQEVIARGVTAVLVSLGERGALYTVEGQAIYCPAAKVKAVNPVGSGDSFSAGWLYAQLMGYSDQMALAVGCSAGAANARVFPAARVGKVDVEALLGYTI